MEPNRIISISTNNIFYGLSEHLRFCGNSFARVNYVAMTSLSEGRTTRKATLEKQAYLKQAFTE